MQPLVACLVLNTNRRADTLACLASLAASTYPRLVTLVLDNASTDGSVEAIRTGYPSTQIIPLTQNLGYAGNNNIGIQAALNRGADWVFILNEDTTQSPDCIAKLVELGESDLRIGMVGPLLYHHNEPEVIQSAGGELSSLWMPTLIGINERDTGQYNAPREVDWLSGCALFVCRKLIEQIGLYDERLFIYWEEMDWCLRARAAGWRLMLAPSAKLWHKGVQRDYRPSPSTTYYFARNQFIVLEKNHAPLRARAFHWFTTFRTLASWSLRPKWKSMKAHRNAMWQGVQDYLGRRWGMRAM